MKCDEGKPACHRCTSTGRVCDGYGIWGGGGNGYHERTAGPKQCRRDPHNNAPIAISPLGAVSTEELGYLEWFTRRSAAKLPGLFWSTFWDKLVLRTCLHEPAILHALLALSATHKNEWFHLNGSVSKKDELFALRQYSKSILHLQPHFSSKSKESMRVALITCLIFVSLEFLRSHYKTGCSHLESGLKLLLETHAPVNAEAMENDIVILIPTQTPDSIDTCIFESFARMHVQAELFGQCPRYLKVMLHTVDPEVTTRNFESVDEARLTLDKLLHGVLLLYYRRRQSCLAKRAIPPIAIESQRRAQSALWSWLGAYNRTTHDFKVPMSLRDTLAYKLLRVYHTMAGIIIDTCLWPTLETRFDNLTYDFASIIEGTGELQKLAASIDKTELPDLADEASRPLTSIVDMGGIPPLYFVAIKCRFPNIRRHAIKLIKHFGHKEGIWDSTLAARVAEEVMQIEEQGFYSSYNIPADPDLGSSPEKLDAPLPPLPESHRLPDVQVILPDTVYEKVKLIYGQVQDDGSYKRFEKVYDADLQCWITVGQ